MTSYSKADIHIHTTYSDGLMTPEALVEYVAEHTDLRVIAVTDHDNLEGALVAKAYRDRFASDFPNLEVIPGMEVTSADGDILALFIDNEIPADLSAEETVRRIHAQGGLAIAAHPCSFVLPKFGDGGMRGAGRQIQNVEFDAVETRNATPTEFFGNPLTAWLNWRGQNLPTTGGSDTHYLTTVGSTYTVFPGTTAADLRHAIETKQVRAGGFIYSPLLIVNVLIDKYLRRLPVQDLPMKRAAHWSVESGQPITNRMRVPALAMRQKDSH